MSRGNHSPSDPKRRLQEWVLDFHIPPFFKRAVPRVVINELLELKWRILSRGLPRNIEFEQSKEDAQASASFSIVVPVHDAPLVTRRCLASLEKYAPKAEIIIVDDGSRMAETTEAIGRFCNQNKWKIIQHEKPLGHSAACGAGVGLATRPYLCLLNSDTVVTPWCWRPVKEVFENDPKVGVAGPSTSRSENPQTLTLAANCISYWDDNQVCNFASTLLAEVSETAVVDLTWVGGFAFFIRRNLWEQLRGFDRNLPDYGNEVELCKRVAEEGYRNVWVRNSYIHHLFHQSYKDVIGGDGITARISAAETYIKQKHYTADL